MCVTTPRLGNSAYLKCNTTGNWTFHPLEPEGLHAIGRAGKTKQMIAMTARRTKARLKRAYGKAVGREKSQERQGDREAENTSSRAGGKGGAGFFPAHETLSSRSLAMPELSRSLPAKRPAASLSGETSRCHVVVVSEIWPESSDV